MKNLNKNLLDKVIEVIENQITNSIKGIEETRAKYHKALADKEFNFESLIEPDVLSQGWDEIPHQILRMKKSMLEMRTEIEVLEKVLMYSGLEYDYTTKKVVEELPKHFEVTRGYVGTK